MGAIGPVPAMHSFPAGCQRHANGPVGPGAAGPEGAGLLFRSEGCCIFNAEKPVPRSMRPCLVVACDARCCLRTPAGEPPLLLAASALCALQAAARAAQQELGTSSTALAQQGAGAGPGQVAAPPTEEESPRSVLDAEGAAAPGPGLPSNGLVHLPANVTSVKAAVGAFDLAARLREALAAGKGGAA